jgi:DNA-binding MarR family transcriptional regulator
MLTEVPPLSREDSLIQLFMKSPLLFDVLRTVSQSDSRTNLAKLARELSKAESTVHAAVQRLIEIDLVNEQRSDVNGRLRLYSIPPRNRKRVDTIIQQVLNRSVPLAMAELTRILASELRRSLGDWEVEDTELAGGRSIWATATKSRVAPVPDLVLRGGGLLVAFELKLGLHYFSKRFRDILGTMVYLRHTRVDLVVLCVFGPVHPEYRRHLESILIPYYSSGRPELMLLFVDEDPRHILADPNEGAVVISAKVVTPVVKKIHSIVATKGQVS